MDNICYKVTCKSKPDLYHNGGYYDIWNRKGKVWTELGALRSFLTSAIKRKTNMSDWRVVEYVVTVKEVKNVSELVNPERLVELLKNVK